MDSNSSPKLTPLLPTTPYLLAYALPLLLLSLLVTFAGTFLTLDRSRSFPLKEGYAAIPAPGGYDLSKKKRKFVWQLEGGIGGLAGGYTFGLHLSTALALLIPATTKSAKLSSNAFLTIWLLSCIVTTSLAGRYRYVAYTFFAVSGGTLSSLSLCVIIHPSLHSRVILVSIFLPLLSILVGVASIIPRLSFTLMHPILRVCTSATGAFGVVMSIALLSKPSVESWANVWERLWLSDGHGWGSGKEQGLSAAFGVLMALGFTCDWALRRWVGECPDEKWDSYLAHYTANLPNQADRAGTFQPLASFWDKVFPPRKVPFPHVKPDLSSKEIIFPSETDGKGKLPLPITMHNVGAGKLAKATPGTAFTPVSRVPTSKDLLKKSRSQKKGWKKSIGIGGRKPVKFGGLDDLSSDSSDDEDTQVGKGSSASTATASSPEIQQKRPWALANQRSYSSNAPTLVDGQTGQKSGSGSLKGTPKAEVPEALDYDLEIARLKQQRQREGKDDHSDYSDYEEDHSRERPRLRPHGQRPSSPRDTGWTPGFLVRHQSSTISGNPLLLPPNGPTPVPATPSLIKALDRIRVAQDEAYGEMTIPDPQPQRRATAAPRERGVGTAPTEAKMERQKSQERAPRWEEFWREVQVKAES